MCGIQGVLPSLIWFSHNGTGIVASCGLFSLFWVLAIDPEDFGFYKWSRLGQRSILGPTLNCCNHCIEIAFVWGSTPERHNQSWCAVLGTAGPKAQGQCLCASTQNPGQRKWWLNWSCWFRINDWHPQYWKIIGFFKIQPAKVQYLGWLNRTRPDSSWNHQMLKSQPMEWWSYLTYLEISGISIRQLEKSSRCLSQQLDAIIIAVAELLNSHSAWHFLTGLQSEQPGCSGFTDGW